VSRIDDDMRDRSARRATQARTDGRKAPGSSPFQKMLKMFKGAGGGPKKGGGGGVKKPQLERKEEARTEARKRAVYKGPAGGGGGGKSGGGGQPQDDDSQLEGAEEERDDEATILEDPSIVERPVVPQGDFRYNPSLHAAIAVPKAAGEGGAALAAEVAKEIGAKLTGRTSGEWRFNLRAGPVKGLSVRARLIDKRLELLVWGTDAQMLAQLKKIVGPLQAEMKALGFETAAVSTALAG
jgi:hypothetical protein